MLKNKPEKLAELKDAVFIKKYLLCFTGGSILLLWVTWFAPIISALLSWPIAKKMSNSAAREMLDQFIDVENRIQAKLMAGSANHQYFNVDCTNSPCGIAVDPVAQTVTILSWSGNLTKELVLELPNDRLKVVTFGVSEIRKWGAVDPGQTTYEAIGLRGNDRLAMAMKNEREASNRRNGQGLLIETDRLECPEILVNLTFEEAKPWVLLLTRFTDRTLPVLTAPQPYPMS